MESKEYKRLRQNEYISWKAFDKITEQMEGKTEAEGKVIENSPEFIKALKRFQKWQKAFYGFIIKQQKNEQ